jgi:LysM repeat protein
MIFFYLTLIALNFQNIQACDQYYTWQDGDFPYLVSSKFGITLEYLYAINNNVINNTPGTIICVSGPIPTTTSTTTTSTISKAVSCGNSCISGCTKYYEVKPGDYSYLISVEQNISLERLYALNNNFNNQYKYKLV